MLSKLLEANRREITQLASIPPRTEPHGRNAASENSSTGVVRSQGDASYAQSGPWADPNQMAVAPSGGSWLTAGIGGDVEWAESRASSRLPASVGQLQKITPAPAIADGAECDNNLTHRVTAQWPASLDPTVVPLPPYFWLYTGRARIVHQVDEGLASLVV